MSESIWFTDSLVRIHLDPADTGSSYALLEMLAPPGHQPPLHVHDEDDEGVFVLEGELTIHLPDGPVVVGPGESGNIPAGTPHTLRVTSDAPLRALLIAAPGRFAEFVRLAGDPAEHEGLPVLTGPPDVDRLARAAAATGTRFLGPPGMLPSDLVAGA